MLNLTAIRARLTGKGWAYDRPDEITEVLAAETIRQRAENLPAHMSGVKNIVQQLGFQPGLVKAHAETHDIGLYLEALATQARSLGYGTLADRLTDAFKATHEANWQIGQATHATIPGAEIPTAPPA
ncbi:hypothetical protein ACT1U9_33015 (plasmid) [Streptomyces sp. BR1]|uniref:hypothetical protein n=1 Tax=Streptomyces sp. BR1 TaxID=1592323 RepID=UPI00402B2A3F